jgi:Zn-dependent protease
VNGSLKIGTAFGIPIRIHWTFLLPLWYGLLVGWPLAQLLPVVLVVFGCVLLHELGHSLVARGYGIRVVDITFWPLGGLARMTEIPENPRIEGAVAIAGPAVNFALAGLAMLLSLVLSSLGIEGDLLAWFALVNLVQGSFNLVPAFPMDGGRLLRAFLARRRGWLPATETAVRVGNWIAGLMLVGSLFLLSRGSLCMLPLVAAFVWLAGSRELVAVRLRHGAFPFGRTPFGAGAGEPRRPDVDVPQPPTVDPGPVERGHARRPTTFDPQVLRRGFDDDTVRRLENYHGRLLRPEEDPPAEGS